MSWLWWNNRTRWFFNPTIRPSQMLGFPLECGGKNQLTVVEKRKFFLKEVSINSTSFEFITIRLLMQGTKSVFLEQNSSPRAQNTQLKPTFEFYLYFCRKVSCHIKKIQNKKGFLASSQCRYHRTIWCSRRILIKKFAFVAYGYFSIVEKLVWKKCKICKFV